MRPIRFTRRRRTETDPPPNRPAGAMRMAVPKEQPSLDAVAKQGDARHPLSRDPQALPLYMAQGRRFDEALARANFELVRDPRFSEVLARANFEATLGDTVWPRTAAVIREHLGGGRLVSLAERAPTLGADEAGAMACELRFVLASILHQLRLGGQSSAGVLKSVAPGAETCLRLLIKASGQAPLDLAAKYAPRGLFTGEPSELKFRKAFAGVASRLELVEALLADCRSGRRAEIDSVEDIENAAAEVSALRDKRFVGAPLAAVDQARFLAFTPAIRDRSVRIDAFSPVNLTVWKKVRGHIDVLCGEDFLPPGWMRFGQAPPSQAETQRRARQRDLALRAAAQSLGRLALAMATLNDPIPSAETSTMETSNDL